MAEQDSDRSQAASPFKLQKARTRGQVAKSSDVAGVVVFAAAALYLATQGWQIWAEQFRMDLALIIQATHVDAGSAMLWPLISQMLRATLILAAPFFITLLLAAILGNLVQTGPVLSLTPVKPDWNRLNIATGFKRLLSWRTLFNAARALLKLAVLIMVSYAALKSLLPHFTLLSTLSPLAALRTLLTDLAGLSLKIAAALGLVAVLDWMYSRREFAKQMRMSRREMKEEVKHREGDPRIRARLRELRRDMLKRSLSVRNTRHADVLITNPTHVAVALRYVHGEMASPQLIAKGSGSLAAKMREIAARHRIPVVQNPPLARKLFRELPLDQHVTPELYAQVARIIVWIYAMRDAQAQTRAQAQSQRAGTSLTTLAGTA